MVRNFVEVFRSDDLAELDDAAALQIFQITSASRLRTGCLGSKTRLARTSTVLLLARGGHADEIAGRDFSV